VHKDKKKSLVEEKEVFWSAKNRALLSIAPILDYSEIKSRLEFELSITSAGLTAQTGNILEYELCCNLKGHRCWTGISESKSTPITL